MAKPAPKPIAVKPAEAEVIPMRINNMQLVNHNITIVYKSLDLSDIDYKSFKKLIDTKPIVTELPEMIVFIWPESGPTIIQLSDNRMRVSHQGQVDQLTDLPSMVTKANSNLSDLTMIAYGFNYEWVADLAPYSGNDLTTQLFQNNLDRVASAFGFPIDRFTARFALKTKELVFDCILDPLNDGKLRIVTNAHYNSEKLPSHDQLDSQFRSNYQYIIESIHKLPQVI